MRRFVLTPAANADLVGIAEYLDKTNPGVTDRVIDALFEAMHLLGERPGIGHERRDLANAPLRFWPVLPYLIIYRAETMPVQVIRILHASRDIRELLGG